MSEENKQEDAVLVAVREEYEKKLEEQRKAFEEEKAKALKEAEEKHIAQIRALLSGQPSKEEKHEQEEKSLFDETMAKMKEKYKI